MIACWIPISPDPSGNYLATPGHRYAALISVDARAPMSAITDALKNQNFNVTYSWQSGQPTRQQFLVDRWLSGLPDPTAGTTWMYFEMNYDGDVPRTLASHIQKCVLFICGTADISAVFEAQDVADDYIPCGPGDTRQPAAPLPGCPACVPPIPPVIPGCPPPPSPVGSALAGAAAGAVLGGLVVWALS